ncbi:L,D-transpeptidase family protein [Prosthecobacter fusiformis]|nr:L,D-transpeptidase [Prosthecobacter fusiformis]
MHLPLRYWLLAACLLSSSTSLTAEDKTPESPVSDMEAATRLQVFLDRANFGPGKIDGHYGGFTEKALTLYRQAQGKTIETAPEPAPKSPTEEKGKEAKTKLPLPDLQDLDVASVDPVFIEYQVTEADVKTVGELPKEIPDMAKLKWLPYTSLAEAVAEKFHSDLDFLKELNPGKLEKLKAGDTIKVPNVEPFDINGVKDMPLLDLNAKREDKDKEKKSAKPNKKDDQDASDPKEDSEEYPSADQIVVTVNTADSMLHLMEKGKLVAAYPVTIGSDQTKSPQGDWKVRGIARLPDFRYDKSFLTTGERSEETFLLPPGPNNAVGVVWIALNKSGIGLHGTSDPDSIGRSASHGCVRLANWDIARLATQLRTGVTVSIH